MGRSPRITLLAAGILVGLSSCDAGAPGSAAHQGQRRNHSEGETMKVTIGSKTFAATLDDNPAAAALKAMLPLTLDMSELNGNEKYSHLAAPLPTGRRRPRKS